MALDQSVAHSLAAALIKRLEACKLTSYQDSVGKWTIGYGHTGPEVHAGQTIEQAIADHDLDVDLAQAGERLGAVIFGHTDQLDDHEYAALLSFVFNVGAGPTWQIWKDINAGNLDDVPTQLVRFDKGVEGGKLVDIPGLDNRRAAEISYWKTADVPEALAQAAQAAPPSSYTVALSTPPTPIPAPPLTHTSLVNKVVTTVAGLAAAGGTLGSQVHDIVAPHADESHVFSMIAVAATGLVVACSIIALLIHGQQAQARTV
jgi:lysozyme